MPTHIPSVPFWPLEVEEGLGWPLPATWGWGGASDPVGRPEALIPPLLPSSSSLNQEVIEISLVQDEETEVLRGMDAEVWQV